MSVSAQCRLLETSMQWSEWTWDRLFVAPDRRVTGDMKFTDVLNIVDLTADPVSKTIYMERSSAHLRSVCSV